MASERELLVMWWIGKGAALAAWAFIMIKIADWRIQKAKEAV